MKVFLRFDTPDGPRTIIAPNVPLLLANQIAVAMSRAGLHAEYVEQYDRLSIADRLAIRKRKDKMNSASNQGNVVPLALGA